MFNAKFIMFNAKFIILNTKQLADEGLDKDTVREHTTQSSRKTVARTVAKTQNEETVMKKRSLRGMSRICHTRSSVACFVQKTSF